MKRGGRVVVAALGGYALGSVPTGLWAGRLAAGVDVRRYGSRATGAANVLRTAGCPAGLVTLVGDGAKGHLAVRLAQAVGAGPWGAAAAAAAATVGHSWPVWAGFSGGKSVMTTVGALSAIDRTTAVLATTGAVAMVAATRRTSVGSLTGAGVATACALWPRSGMPPAARAYALFGAGFLVLRHRENLGRLLRGTEPRLGERAPGMPVAPAAAGR